MPSRDSFRRLLAGLTVAVLVAALPVIEAGAPVSAEELPHTHGGELLLAVDATHGSQPAHFDASSLRHARHCSACLGHSRTTGRLTVAGEGSLAPPAASSLALLQADVAFGPQIRRDSSRAPPPAA